MGSRRGEADLVRRGIVVRVHCEQRGLGLIEAAHIVGVPPPELRKVQRGEAPLRVVKQVEDALGIGGGQ